MSENEDKLNQLQTRLTHLERYEEAFKRELAEIRRQIYLLKQDAKFVEPQKEQVPAEKEQIPHQKPPIRDYQTPPQNVTIFPKTFEKETKQQSSSIPKNEKVENTVAYQVQNNLEKFIGENLISKIGIIILIIGVAIGAKYAIDNDLISPLMRIVFGYVVGLILIGFAVKLKAKYHNYSAVLMSGGMAIMYFITYFAYNFYSLLPQTSTFGLMVIFTVFTVIAAIIYNQQIIAHIGLVGAYAVPFLLSESSGRVAILFIYIAIINVGILAISVSKYWKPLFYTSFIFTWLIYGGWYVDKFKAIQHFDLALTFLSIFFAIFYLTFIAYKLINKETFKVENVALILSNSFLFFGIGYSILDSANLEKFLGLFAVINALIHFVVGFVIHKFKLGDRTAFYFIVALVLTFISIAVPIQFDGNFVTLVWIAEAVFLFVIGRTQKIALFEYYSYPLMLLTCGSLFNDWQSALFFPAKQISDAIYPIFNGNFVTSLTVAIGFGVICFVDRIERFETAVEENFYQIIKFAIPTVFLIILYNTFRVEIGNYYHLQELQTAKKSLQTDIYGFTGTVKDTSLTYFNFIWQLNYTILFLTVLSFFNIYKLKNAALGFANLLLNSMIVLMFLVFGLIVLGLLSSEYLNPKATDYFTYGISHILIRYISFAFVAALFFASYKYVKQEFLAKYVPTKVLLTVFDLGFYFSLLVIISSELILWSDVFKIDEIYKLGLSILFGLYALVLVILGIIQRKSHLRYFAIAIFGMTLIKLFIYDLAELDTISKTVVFVSVGILLLVVSFIYTKYKNVIFDDEKVALNHADATD